MKIPQENIKRGHVRDHKEMAMVRADVGHSKGLKTDTLIGWFSNKYNMAEGWMIHALTEDEKKEFGNKNIFRTYSERTDTTNIIKINIEKGTYAFLSNRYEEENIIEFDKMSSYKLLKIENSLLAFDEFNIL